jgi:hypothetical protein
MKKLFGFIMAIAIVAAFALPGFAQDRNCRRTSDSRSYNSRGYYDNRSSYDNRGYYDNRSSSSYDNRGSYDNSRAYYDYQNRSFWSKHRDKLTVGAGTAAGAAIGAIVGGRRGAAIGAITGAAGSALYTYKIRNRRYRY